MQFLRLLLRALTDLNFVLVLAVFLFFASLALNKAHAQQTLPEVKVTDRNILPNERLPLDTEIKTGSRLGITARETPASVTVVDRQSIEARDARDTQEALRAAPGLTAAAPPGGAGFVSMRGFNSSQITQLFNGISVQYDVIAARPVDAWLLDRIEVIGGPSSFLFGAGAVGGAINYVSKVAQREKGTHDFYAAHGSFNTNRVSYGYNGALGGDQARNWVRLDVSHQDSDGFVKPGNSKSNVMSMSWLADIAPNLSHTLAYEYVDEDRLPYWGTPILRPSSQAQVDPATIRQNYNVSDGLYTNQVQWIRSILEYRVSDATKVQNTVYGYDAERLYRNVEVYRWNATNTAIDRGSLLATRHGQRLWGNRFEITHKSTLLGMPSDWAAGVDLSVNKQTRFPFSASNITGTTGVALDTVNPYSPNLRNFFSFAGVQDATNPDRDNRVLTRAFFAENRTKLLPRLSVVTGLRADSIDIGVKNYRAATPTDPRFFSASYKPMTGRIGLIYDLTPAANVYVTYSTAADPPSGILATATFAALRDFDMTKGKQFEVGTKFDFLDRRGSATLAAYRIVRRNLSMTDPANSANSIPIGQQSSAGIEANVGYRISQAWRMQANAAYVNPRYDSFNEAVGALSVSRAGNDPTNTPRRVVNAWLTWNPAPDWETGAGYRHVGRVYADTANTLSVPGYDLWDAYLSYKVRKDSTLALRVRNLADKTYVQQTTGTPMFLYGEPRSIELSLRSAF